MLKRYIDAYSVNGNSDNRELNDVPPLDSKPLEQLNTDHVFQLSTFCSIALFDVIDYGQKDYVFSIFCFTNPLDNNHHRCYYL